MNLPGGDQPRRSPQICSNPPDVIYRQIYGINERTIMLQTEISILALFFSDAILMFKTYLASMDEHSDSLSMIKTAGILPLGSLTSMLSIQNRKVRMNLSIHQSFDRFSDCWLNI